MTEFKCNTRSHGNFLYGKMSFYLLDCWDTFTREVTPGGFSAVRTTRGRKLEHLPRCPDCNKPVWLLTTRYPFSVVFTGQRVGDVAFHLGSTVVVSERFMRAWLEAGLSGLSFSDGPLKAKFAAGPSVRRADAKYFAAYPEPELSPLSESAGACYENPPDCSTCGCAVVKSLTRLEFAASSIPTTDFFLPSSLSGWFGVSQRAMDLTRARGFQNFLFVTGFSCGPDRQLECRYV